MTSNMASSRTVAASMQRNLLRRNPIRVAAQLPQHCLQRNSTWTRPRASLPRFIASQRSFSISIPRRFADVHDEFDPRSIERESDEVDVCIVGGGELSAQILPACI